MNLKTSEGDLSISLTSTKPCRRFSLAEIQSATKDFDDKLVIGQGGFGKVYRGQVWIEELSHIFSEEAGHVVAIKRLDSTSNQGELEFRAEIEMLSMLRHSNLVSLIGYCDDNKEMILVYDYMPHGTLYEHLHIPDTHLNWVQRLKIAIGAGHGLDYLHSGVANQHGVIHRDVKSSNILLNENWDAMISDFGLSKIGPTSQSYVVASVKGTFGYLDPEYFYTRKLTRKTDVYAFGVVLFELLSGRLPVDISYGEEECSLVRWVQKCVKGRKFDQMVDSNIRGEIFPKCLRRFAQIAYRCLLSVPKERPTMADIVISLQTILELQKKWDNSANSLSTTRFTWKLHKYLVFATKENYDQSGTSSTMNLENNINEFPSTNESGRDHVGIPYQRKEIIAKDLKRFTFDELSYATKGFSEATFLGTKNHTTVYKGWDDKTTYSPSNDNRGVPIIIKLMDYNEVVDLKMAELDVEILKEFNHTNLVELIGWCLQGKQLFLVYEYLPNGNFHNLLNSGTLARLPLVTKVKIVIGIARGIIFLNEIQQEVVEYPIGNVSKSRLYRHKILFDEDFTVKLSGYDIPKLVYGYYPPNDWRKNNLVGGDYYPGLEPFLPQCNLSGFTGVFIEVLTGIQITKESELDNMDGLLRKSGKRSLRLIAKMCFEICNEVNSESKMLTILEGYENYIYQYANG